MTSNMTVIAGEGLESDDDDVQTSSFMKNTMVSSTMVSGEASETDEEDEDDVENKSPYSAPMAAETLHLDAQGTVSLTTTLDEFAGTDSSTIPTKKAEKAKRHKLVYKYDS
jgi:hypothetical protein